MSKRLINPALRKALLEGPDAIAEVIAERVDTPQDLDIASMRKRGLAAIDRLMRCITSDISTGNPARETVQNLKDAMTMLNDLKDIEDEALEGKTEEELEKLANDN